MRLSRSAKVVLGIVTALVFLFIYTPLLLVVVNSFNADRTFGWPPKGFTLEWWGKAFDSPGVREAVVSSLWVAVVSTIISLVLGTLLAISLQRYEFFGRDVINLLVILPIALPGVVTGIALNNMFTTILGVPLSLLGCADDAEAQVLELGMRGPGQIAYLARMVVKSSRSATVVELASVDWIEADGDYLELHAGSKVHLVRGTLSALEPRLDPREFVRIHRSTIVRISRVKELVPQLHGDYVVALSSGARLRLSRSYRARLGAALGAEL